MLTLSKDFQKIFFGSLSVFCFCAGVPASLIALSTSLPDNGRKMISRFLYKLILITDFTICLLVLPVCISNFRDWAPGVFSIPVVCEVWSFLWGCAGRISVFLITVLSIVRTKTLASPLRPVNQNHVLVPVAIYVLGIFIQGTVPAWFKIQVHFFEQFQCCVWFIDDLFQKFTTVEEYVFYSIIYLVEFVAPIIPVTISGIISALDVRNSHVVASSMQLQQTKQHATRMILTLTGIYITFNIPYCIVLTLDCIQMFSQGNYSWTSVVAPSTAIFIYNFIYVHTIALNSVANTLIYVYKMKSIYRLRNMIKQKVSRLSPRSTYAANT